MRLNPLASILEKKALQKGKKQENIKKGEAGRVKPMIYLPPGNCRNKRSLLKQGSLWSTKCAFLGWSLMIHLVFWGLCFCLFVFCFSLSQKTTIILGNVFVCFCSAVSLKHPPQRVPKTLKTSFFLVCVWLVLSLCLQNQAPYKKQRNKQRKKITTPENKQRLSLQKSQSVGLLTLQIMDSKSQSVELFTPSI